RIFGSASLSPVGVSRTDIATGSSSNQRARADVSTPGNRSGITRYPSAWRRFSTSRAWRISRRTQGELTVLGLRTTRNWRACSIAWAISGANVLLLRRLRESTQTGIRSPSRARRSAWTNASSLVAWEMNTGPLLMRHLLCFFCEWAVQVHWIGYGTPGPSPQPSPGGKGEDALRRHSRGRGGKAQPLTQRCDPVL